MGDKSRSTSSEGGGDGCHGNEMEDYTHTTARNSSTSVMEGGNGSNGGGSSASPGNTGERAEGSPKRVSAARSKKTPVEETPRDGDCSARAGRTEPENSMARAASFTPPTVPSNDLGPTKTNEDTFSLVGQKVQEEKDFMEVSSPLKPTPQPTSINKPELGSLTKSTGQVSEKKPKAKVQLKKIAREKGRAKDSKSEVQLIPVGSKRTGKLIFEEEVENLYTKKRCTETGTFHPTPDERLAVAALQHRREQ